MPTGFNLYSDDGKLLIDSNRLYYGLVKSGPLEWFTSNNGNWNNYGVTVYAESPIVYIEGGAVPVSVVRDGNWWTFYYRPIEYLHLDSGHLGSPPSVPWVFGSEVRAYIFDRIQPNKSRMGLEIFNDSGSVIFNSDQWPLNIAALSHAPPVPTWINHRPPYSKIDGWLYDTLPSAQYAYECSVGVDYYGLSRNRRYAWNQPWTRGARGYGNGDDRVLFEAAITAGGMLGYTWQLDPFTNPDFSDLDYQPVFDTYPHVSALTLIDVTDLPYPFIY